MRPTTLFRVEPAGLRIGHELGVMTLIYHRRSGITHMVSEPVPQILAALEDVGPADAAAVSRHLAIHFDLRADEEAGVETVISVRLEELALLGLVLRAQG